MHAERKEWNNIKEYKIHTGHEINVKMHVIENPRMEERERKKEREWCISNT